MLDSKNWVTSVSQEKSQPRRVGHPRGPSPTFTKLLQTPSPLQTPNPKDWAWQLLYWAPKTMPNFWSWGLKGFLIISLGSRLDFNGLFIVYLFMLLVLLFASFCFFWRHGRNFTLNNYYCDVSLSPRQVVWQCRKMSLFELASSACNGPMTKVQKQHIYWEVASTYNPNFKTSKCLSQRRHPQDYFHVWQRRDFFKR